MRAFFTTGVIAFLSLIATAQPAAAAEGGGALGGLGVFFPLVVLVAIFYFFIIRPQNKRLKDHRDLVASLQRGDEVITSGGIIGKIHRVISDSECVIEIADNVRVHVVKATITGKRGGGAGGAGNDNNSGTPAIENK